MKKILLFLAFNVALSTRAQYTITANSNPVVGDVTSEIGTYSVGLSVPTNGTNKFWNYTSIQIDTSTASSATYVPMSSVPNAGLFNGANIGLDYGSGSYFDVFKITSTSREELGSAAPTPSDCVSYSNTFTLMTLPFSYGSNNYDTFAYNQGNSTSSGSVNVSADGSGTLSLPGYTFSNTLKVSSTYTIFQTSPGYTVTEKGVSHSFYSAASKFPLFSVNSETFVTTTTSVTTDYSLDGTVNSLFSIPVGIRTYINDISFNVFPNPVQQNDVLINFNSKLGKTLNIKLVNSIGEVERDIYYKVLEGENKLCLDTKSIAPGIYYIRISDNLMQCVQKLIIQ